MANLLLTGGRYPATLSLARALHRAGHAVFGAESLPYHLSSSSRAFLRNYRLPSPRLDRESFLRSLDQIIRENNIDLLIPMFEETYLIASSAPRLSCRVFTDDLGKLSDLHNKWSFVLNAISHDLPVPETMLVGNKDDLLHAYAQWRNLDLKPVHSRYSSGHLINPALKQAVSALHTHSQWIAQEHVAGDRFGTYSISHGGRITAHATYACPQSGGCGSPVAVRQVDHPAILQWVKSFLGARGYNGQISLEFIQTAEGKVQALECHPHSSIGLHLLVDNPQLVQAFLNPRMDPFASIDHRSCMLAADMLFKGLPHSLRQRQFGKWLSTFLTSDDVILDPKDPLPALLQLRSFAHLAFAAMQRRISLAQAFTHDIEWEWEELPTTT